MILMEALYDGNEFSSVTINHSTDQMLTTLKKHQTTVIITDYKK